MKGWGLTTSLMSDVQKDLLSVEISNQLVLTMETTSLRFYQCCSNTISPIKLTWQYQSTRLKEYIYFGRYGQERCLLNFLKLNLILPQNQFFHHSYCIIELNSSANRGQHERQHHTVRNSKDMILTQDNKNSRDLLFKTITSM